MKIKVLSALLFAFLMVCCGDDFSPADLDGYVFLAKGKVVKANTNFTREELINQLTSNKCWFRTSYFYYDDNSCGKNEIEKTDDKNIDGNSKYDAVSFDSDGTGKWMLYSGDKRDITWELSMDGKTLIVTYIYVSGNKGKIYHVKSIDPGRLVVDEGESGTRTRSVFTNKI